MRKSNQVIKVPEYALGDKRQPMGRAVGDGIKILLSLFPAAAKPVAERLPSRTMLLSSDLPLAASGSPGRGLHHVDCFRFQRRPIRSRISSLAKKMASYEWEYDHSGCDVDKS